MTIFNVFVYHHHFNNIRTHNFDKAVKIIKAAIHVMWVLKVTQREAYIV